MGTDISSPQLQVWLFRTAINAFDIQRGLTTRLANPSLKSAEVFTGIHNAVSVWNNIRPLHLHTCKGKQA